MRRNQLIEIELPAKKALGLLRLEYFKLINNS